jgi:hypothetical protein
MQDTKKPHWAWPHVIGVLVAIIVYFLIYRFTGDSDLFVALVAVTTGAGGMAAAWGYLRFLTFSRDKKSGPTN